MKFTLVKHTWWVPETGTRGLWALALPHCIGLEGETGFPKERLQLTLLSFIVTMHHLSLPEPSHSYTRNTYTRVRFIQSELLYEA